MSTSMENWTSNMISGGSPVLFSDPRMGGCIFSLDGRYCLTFLTFSIRVYYIATRQCIRTIEFNMKDIVHASIDPSNPNHVLLISSEGLISVLNWKERTTQPFVSQAKIPSTLNISAVIKIDINRIITLCDRINDVGIKIKCLVKIDRGTWSCENVYEIEKASKYAISADSRKLAILLNTNDIFLLNLNNLIEEIENEANKSNGHSGGKVQSETLKFPYKSPVTSMAVSNTSIVALGTLAGPIQIIYGDVSIQSQKLLKWHIDEVKALAFTNDGTYLLSGGLEKVLAFWQLETDNLQFLPRLNGPIEKISTYDSVPNLYTLSLNMTPSITGVNEVDAYIETIVISAVDLVSRLSINGPRPNFSHRVRKTLPKTKKKYLKSKDKFDKSKVRYDYTSSFTVHPKTKVLYFPNGPSIQAYDLSRNEQEFVQNISQVLPIGKVRTETKLIDPSVKLLAFCAEGRWMCTFDVIEPSKVDNLFSKNDKSYALKFWEYVENGSMVSGKPDSNHTIDNKNCHWELSTKIIDPHGNGNEVLSLIPIPKYYNEGFGFLTADCKGGLRLWVASSAKEVFQSKGQGRLPQTTWKLRKSRSAGTVSSDSVDICWSDDGSVIFLSHECKVIGINAANFEEISSFSFSNLAGSRIRSIQLLQNYLIVLSKTKLLALDLLSYNETELVARVNTSFGDKQLLCAHKANNTLCFAMNYYDDDDGDFKLKSKIFVFRPHLLKPIFVHLHDRAITSLKTLDSSFIYVDSDARLGIVQPSNDGLTMDFAKDLSEDLSAVSIAAETVFDTEKRVDEEEGNDENKVFDLNTFGPIFDRTEDVTVSALFDRIIKAIK